MSEHQITIAEIQQAVCAEFRVGIKDMRSHSRRRAVARPRQVAMYLARKLTPLSYPEIAKHFSHRDHTTVLYACQMIPTHMSIDHGFGEAVLRVIDTLRDPNQMLLPLAAD